jgi:hypothetical protein
MSLTSFATARAAGGQLRVSDVENQHHPQLVAVVRASCSIVSQNTQALPYCVQRNMTGSRTQVFLRPSMTYAIRLDPAIHSALA